MSDSSKQGGNGGHDRLYELDLLRFLAAFAVLLFHFAFRGPAGGLTVVPYPSITGVAKYGFMGVSLFFLISGFVVLMSAAGGSMRRFVVSRFVRLYPAFWLCCTVTFVVMLAFADQRALSLREYAINMTMLNGFVGVRSVDAVYWSLFVELKFYFLIFLTLLFGQIHRIKPLLTLWLAAYLVNSVWPIKYLSFFLIPDFAPYFIAGAFFFLMHKEGVSLFKLVMVSVCFVVAGFEAIPPLAELAVKYGTPMSKMVSWLGLGAFFVAFFLVASGRSRRWASPRYLLLGALTYPLYLLHQNIGYALLNRGYGRVNTHVLLWGVTALMLLAAYAVTRFERLAAPPLKAALTRLLSPKPKPADQSAPRVAADV
jgi:peptidoglycan/LPS O-acetylase OafA/YrhL